MNRWKILILFIISSYISFSQELLLREDFNDCALPSNWSLSVSNGQDAGVIFGTPINTNSDSLSIDGTCMVIFDDDILGNNQPSFKAELKTPMISTKGYQSIELKTDIHFRQYGTSTFTVYLEEIDGERKIIQHYQDGGQTGNQFSEYNTIAVDLSFYTTSETFQIVYVYDDKEMFAWWAGIDNVSLVGNGQGESLVKEQFNDCVLPEGWSTNILEGDFDWMIGYVDNENASATSMNGSCFAYFDDDGIGNDAAFSTIDLFTPIIDGSAYANFLLEFDLIFRPYADLENISIYVFDGKDYFIVEEFSDAVGGPQFNNYVKVKIDLTNYRSEQMQVVFRYDDGNDWGWWVGVDNVKISGEGEINDLCSNAEILDIGKACIPSNNSNAVFSGPAGSCGDNLKGGLWYALTAPADGLVKIVNESNYNDIISVLSGSCSELLENICINKDEHGFNGEILFFDVVANKQYWVRVSGIESDYGLSRGDNCLSAHYVNDIPLPTLEDIVDNAIQLLPDNNCISAQNINATFNDILPSRNSLMRSDVWYKFNTGEMTSYNIWSNSTFSEYITVYDSDLTEVYAHDSGYKFKIENLVPQQEYYIQVGGVFSELEGEVCIILESEIPNMASQDSCLEAVSVSMDVDYTVDVSDNAFSGIQPSCEIYVDKDYWVRFSTLDITDIYITLQSTYTNTVTVYQGTCNNLEEVYCHKGLNFCDGPLLIPSLQPQTVYYLQISSTMQDIDPSVQLSVLRLSETKPDFEAIDLSVTSQCNEDGEAQLELVVTGSNDYSLLGNSSQEILYDGDEFSVVAVNKNGCESAVKGKINCQSTDCNLKLIPYLDYVTCHQGSDGNITIELSGGIGPYEYEWSHSDINQPSIFDLQAGFYSVKVTDAMGCYVTQDIEIKSPNALSTNIEVTDISNANINDGMASIMASGGTPPYSYLWSEGSTTASVTELAAGDYEVTVTDYNGCFNVHTFSIAEIDCVFSIDVITEQVSCHGGNDGSLSLSSDEVNLEAVIWNTGQLTSTISELSGGLYSVTVTATNGCDKIQEIMLQDPLEITTLVSTEPVRCHGDSDGIGRIIADGGTGELSYLWPDGSTQKQRDNLASGEYKVTITDSKFCTKEELIFIESPDELIVASAMGSMVTCHDSQDGVACVFVDGGTAPYIFSWGEGLEPLSKLMDLSPGNYDVSVIDVNGCSTDTVITIVAPSLIEVTLEELSISNNQAGVIDISISGGIAPYNITWYQGNEIISTEEDLINLNEGVYHAVIIDSNGCEFNSLDFVLSLTGVAELSAEEIKIFPNPAIDHFTIQADIDNWSDYTIDLVSLDGHIIPNAITYSEQNNGVVHCKVNPVINGAFIIKLQSRFNPEDQLQKAILIMNPIR